MSFPEKKKNIHFARMNLPASQISSKSVNNYNTSQNKRLLMKHLPRKTYFEPIPTVALQVTKRFQPT